MIVPQNMADSRVFLGDAVPAQTDVRRHSAVVRVTHWLTTVCVLALLLSGIEILISHPRFYWGETGSVTTPSLFDLPLPASRPWVKTGYGFVLPDQNGWSRYLHFQSAWALVIAGFIYVAWGLWSGHFRSNLFPAQDQRSWGAVVRVLANHLRLRRPDDSEAHSYNVVQRASYLLVIFILFPFVIWTGLAMSPAFNSAFPLGVNILGGRQSARTLHFFVSILLVLFLIVHVGMIVLAGFWSRTRTMITGPVVLRRESAKKELA